MKNHKSKKARDTPPPSNSHLDIKVKLLKTNGEEKNPRKNLGVIQEKKRHLQRSVWCEL